MAGDGASQFGVINLGPRGAWRGWQGVEDSNNFDLSFSFSIDEEEGILLEGLLVEGLCLGRFVRRRIKE